MKSNTTLPSPDPDAKALSDRLMAEIKAEIAEKAEITFSQYMSMALYFPGLGYYSNGSQKFGETGDFVTAPEISSLFSRCLGNQCLQVLTELGGGDILEFGAGRGVMAADVLLHLELSGCLPEHYYILELSGQLKSVQQQMIASKAPHLLRRVSWLSSLPDSNFSGVVLANEVLDAMPVTQFHWDNGPKECGVINQNNQLVTCALSGENAVLTNYMASFSAAFSQGYTSEVNLHLLPWLRSLANSLVRGVILLIDYGFPRHEYYHPDRNQGTLMCHYKHFAHQDLYFYPGLQDITAHVDFTAVAEAADLCDLEVAGYTNQAAFLMNAGLLKLLDANASEASRFKENQAVLRLTMPSEMGELFKVMALTKGYEKALLGFQTMDQLSRL